jgi:DNA-directed RNA polymerase sigma subunit (sigma70/sigma32)
VETLEDRIARREAILRMRDSVNPETGKPWTLFAIAQSFDPPLSKERVRQIIAEQPRGVGRPRRDP